MHHVWLSYKLICETYLKLHKENSSVFIPHLKHHTSIKLHCLYSNDGLHEANKQLTFILLLILFS